jgi:hypothetical protein
MAVSESILGRNEWALRLPGAALGALSILLLYKLLSRDASANSAALVTLGVAVSSLFVLLARHAQLDIYLFFFTLASALTFARYKDESVIRGVVLPGLLFGLALLSKFGFAIILAPLFLVVAPKVRPIRVIAALAVAVIVALPWYIWMRTQHPEFGLHALSVASNASYEATTHAWWFYANQIVVAVPLVVLMLVPSAYDGSRRTIVSLLSILAVIVLLLSMATSLSAYVMLLLLPIALFLASAVDRILASSRRTQWVGLGLVVIASGWAASEQFRLLVKGVRSFAVTTPPTEFVMILTLFVTTLILLRRTTVFLMALGAILAAFLGQRLYQVMFTTSSEFGARATVSMVDRTCARNPLVLSGSEPHEELMPQLSYYLAGKRVSTIREADWRGVLGPYDAAIVQRHKDRLAMLHVDQLAAWQRTDSLLARKFSRKLSSGCYELYYGVRD